MRQENKEKMSEKPLDEENDFIHSNSSACCYLRDINGIMYGGISSRYWMLRKHINSLEIAKMADEDMPFYAWECISLNLAHRDVDLVIKNEKDMNDFITLISYHMQTVDNSKDSANFINAHITKLKLRQAKAKDENIGRRLTAKMKERIGDLSEKEKLAILKTTVMKYKIMRIRSKLSFTAFKANMTI